MRRDQGRTRREDTGMTNGFSVDPGSLPAIATALSAAAAPVRGLSAPGKVDAGRSSDELAAAVLQLVGEASARGTEVTELAAAFVEAARVYAASDDAVAAALSRWAP